MLPFTKVFCFLLVSLVLNFCCVDAYKTCFGRNPRACSCNSGTDCPRYAHCIDNLCNCLSGSENNGTHVTECKQCTHDDLTSCPTLATCENQQCFCEFGVAIFEDDAKTRYVCKECSFPQDCPAFAECELGHCQCKFGVVSKDSKTGKVLQCEDNNINPVVIVAIAVPLTAALMGIAGVVAFYFYWRLVLRPAENKSSYNFGYVNDEKNGHPEEKGSPTFRIPYDTRHSPRELPQHHSTPKEKASPKSQLPTIAEQRQEPIPAQQDSPKGSPKIPLPERTPPASVNLPVSPLSPYSDEDLPLPPPPAVHHSSKEDLRASSAHRGSKEDLPEEPEHRLQKGEFHSIPSHETDSEDEDNEPAVIPVVHQPGTQQATDAPLLVPSGSSLC